MAQFYWRGVYKNGRRCKGMQQAESQAALTRELHAQGIGLLHATQKSEGTKSAGVKLWHRVRSYLRPQQFSLQQSILFFELVGTLTESGIPLIRLLSLVTQQVSAVHQQALRTIEAALQEGTDVATALEISGLFSSFDCAVLAIGQKTGTLSRICLERATDLRVQLQLKKECMRALLPPLITLAFGVIVCIVLSTSVLPAFLQLFTTMQVQLPLLSQIVCRSAAMVQNLPAAFFWLVLLCVMLAMYVVQRYNIMRDLSMRLLWHIPFVGAIMADLSMYYYVQALQVYTMSGSALEDALQQAIDVIWHPICRRKIVQVSAQVNMGIPCWHALEEGCQDVISEEIRLLLRMGEESGQMAIFLERAARLMHQSIERRVHRVTTVAAPLVLFVVGGLVAGMLLAVYLPIFKLAECVL